MTETAVVVTRIDADPVDQPLGLAWNRIREKNPEVTASIWNRMLEFLPGERQRTHVSLNDQAWPSSSDFLLAVSTSPGIADLLDSMPRDGWLDRHAQWERAEAEDAERWRRGGPTMLRWRRPLVRIGAHVEVRRAQGMTAAAAELVKAELGSAMVLAADEGRLVLVLPGMVQDLEQRVVAALRTDLGDRQR